MKAGESVFNVVIFKAVDKDRPRFWPEAIFGAA